METDLVIIDFYKSHSARETIRKFHLRLDKLNTILDKHGIQRHPTIRVNLTDTEIKMLLSLYPTTSDIKICSIFHITKQRLYSILKTNNITPHTEVLNRSLAQQNVFTLEQELEICTYYQTHSLTATSKKFHTSNDKIINILSTHNICLHSEAENKQIKSIQQNIGLKNYHSTHLVHGHKSTKRRQLTTAEKNELIIFHKLHTDSETRRHFKLSYPNYEAILQELGIAKHTAQEVAKLKIFTKLSNTEIEIILDNYKTNSDCYIIKNFHISKESLHFLLSVYGIKPHSVEENRKLGAQKFKRDYLVKTGFENVMQNPMVQEKARQTCKIKYGYEFATQAEEIKLKSKQTSLEKYGVESFSQTKQARLQMRKNSEAWLQKKYETQKRNHTFNTSKYEIELTDALQNKFGKQNILTQYKEERYPFNCDFYIKPYDTFIELNLTWTHGGHHFNKSKEDLLKLFQWNKKAELSNYYKNAIYTWTDLDCRKHEFAKQNNLKYITIYSKQDFILFVNELTGIDINNENGFLLNWCTKFEDEEDSKN